MDTSTSARLRAGVTTTTAAQTRALAEAWARELPDDQVIALHGDLGAGKTTFVQGLAHGLGVADAVTSPTFTLYNVHRGTRARLVHLDAYRLGGDAQMDELMLEDFLVTPWILAVEWPERIASWLPPQAYHVELGINAEMHHTLRLR